MQKTLNRSRYALLLTGDCRYGRHRARVKGKDVWLTPASFGTLCELAAARSVGEGFLAVPRLSVHRMREAIRAAGLGDDLFERGRPKHYRLVYSKSQIAVTDNFFELPAELFRAEVRRAISERFLRIAIA